MPIEYSPNDDMTNAVSAIIADETYEEFQAIRDQELVFLVAAMTKTNTDEEVVATAGEPVVIRRIGPADAVFVTGHFKVYIDTARWDEASELKRNAMIHRAICRVKVDVTDNGIRIATQKPDVTTFQINVVRFGAWEENLIALRNNLQNAQRKAKEAAAEMASPKK